MTDSIVREVLIPEEQWEIADNDYLVASIRINGVLLHLNAIRVWRDETDHLLHSAHEEKVDLLWAGFEMSGTEPQTLTIRGHEYLVFAEPADS